MLAVLHSMLQLLHADNTLYFRVFLKLHECFWQQVWAHHSCCPGWQGGPAPPPGLLLAGEPPGLGSHTKEINGLIPVACKTVGARACCHMLWPVPVDLPLLLLSCCGSSYLVSTPPASGTERT
jgi:hypothetical protein